MLAISNLEGAQSRLHGGIDGAGKTPTTNDDLSHVSCLISSAADLINNALIHAEASPTAEEDAAGARPTGTTETHPAPDEVSVLTTTFYKSLKSTYLCHEKMQTSALNCI